MMNNEITPYNEPSATLLEMRSNPERFPRLHTYEPDKAIDVLKAIILKAYLYRGQTTFELDFIAKNLYNELMEGEAGTRNLSFGEIHYAIRKAVLGDAELYGISVASLYKVIVNYAKGEGHQADKSAREESIKREIALRRASTANAIINAYANKLIKK